MTYKCKRGILISKTPYETRYAIMEDGELAELVAVELDFQFLVLRKGIQHIVHHFLLGNLDGNIRLVLTRFQLAELLAGF